MHQVLFLPHPLLLRGVAQGPAAIGWPGRLPRVIGAAAGGVETDTRGSVDDDVCRANLRQYEPWFRSSTRFRSREHQAQRVCLLQTGTCSSPSPSPCPEATQEGVYFVSCATVRKPSGRQSDAVLSRQARSAKNSSGPRLIPRATRISTHAGTPPVRLPACPQRVVG